MVGTMVSYHDLFIMVLAIVVASRTCSSSINPQICYKFSANQSSAAFGPPCPKDVASKDQICDAGFVQALSEYAGYWFGYRLNFACVHPLSDCCMEACADFDFNYGLRVYFCTLFSDALLQVSDDPDSWSQLDRCTYDLPAIALASLLS